jgi:hypothetical protein
MFISRAPSDYDSPRTTHRENPVLTNTEVVGFLKQLSALGQSATSASHMPMSERSPEADIELSCVNVAEEHRRGVSKSTFPVME